MGESFRTHVKPGTLLALLLIGAIAIAVVSCAVWFPQAFSDLTSFLQSRVLFR
jgi:hypothetical protein